MTAMLKGSCGRGTVARLNTRGERTGCWGGCQCLVNEPTIELEDRCHVRRCEASNKLLSLEEVEQEGYNGFDASLSIKSLIIWSAVSNQAIKCSLNPKPNHPENGGLYTYCLFSGMSECKESFEAGLPYLRKPRLGEVQHEGKTG